VYPVAGLRKEASKSFVWMFPFGHFQYKKLIFFIAVKINKNF
jgi:hypothetical protein